MDGCYSFWQGGVFPLICHTLKEKGIRTCALNYSSKALLFLRYIHYFVGLYNYYSVDYFRPRPSSSLRLQNSSMSTTCNVHAVMCTYVESIYSILFLHVNSQEILASILSCGCSTRRHSRSTSSTAVRVLTVDLSTSRASEF